MSKAPAIGIDLGTSYSRIGIYQNGKVDTIANDQGNRKTPSQVAFTDTERLVGEIACSYQFASSSFNTVFDAKRLIGLIGRSFHGPIMNNDRKFWPFTVVKGGGGTPKVQVQYMGTVRQFTPEEVCSMILAKMKETAEEYLGNRVTDAVITVPAYFSFSQRQAIKDACASAGLNVLRLINESVAAAFAYGVHTKITQESNYIERNTLVFDLGGGTLSVSVVTREDDIYEVKSTSGSSHLGGKDFDNRMVEYFANEFKRRHNKDIFTNPKSIHRLSTVCNHVKHVLSSCLEAPVNINALFEGIDFHTTMTRARFEELNADLFREAIGSVETALKCARFDKSEIHEVVLVGGSTRIPKIQHDLQTFFNGKELKMFSNSDELMACGAAILAAILSGDQSQEIEDILLLDITPFSLGIRTAGGVMTTMICKNSTIPKKESQIFTTCSDYQTSVLIQVYEGNHAIADQNNFLGNFELTGIPPAPRGEALIEITFDIDRSNIMTVSAIDRSTSRENAITITRSSQHVPGIDSRGKNIQPSQPPVGLHDEPVMAVNNQNEQTQAKTALETYAFQMKSAMEDDQVKRKLSKEDRLTVIGKCNEVISWLDSNHWLVGRDQFDYQQKQLDKVCLPIMSKLY